MPGQLATNCVYLNGRLYIAAGDNCQGCSCGFSVDLNLLSVFDVSSSELRVLSAPPVERFALTHYHSQLVLVGGVKPGISPNKRPTDELWASTDGTDWKPLLPPMRIKRSDASAVNTGSPEYLVVVGGVPIDRFQWTTTVEVLINKEWFIVQPLPSPLNYPRAWIHNWSLIVTEVKSQTPSSIQPGCCCHLDALLAPCFQPEETEKTSSCEEFPIGATPSVWREFPIGATPCMLSFGHQLIAVCGSIFGVLCPSTDTWLPIPVGPACLGGTVLPTGEILMVGNETSRDLSIYQGSLKCKCRVSPWLVCLSTTWLAILSLVWYLS